MNNYSYAPVGEKAIKHHPKLAKNLTLCATISSSKVEMLRYFFGGGTKKEMFEEYFAIFISEILWRKSAVQNLTEKIDNYELAIRDTIGLRLQSRLTKEQAKYVAKCRSVHRDISLNF